METILSIWFLESRVIQKHKRGPASIRHLIPLMFVLFLTFGGILSIFSNFIKNVYFLILGLYLLLDLLFSAKISIKKRIWNI